MRKTQVDTFKSLLQAKNLRHGPILNYNGDPEEAVEAKPGTICFNLNYGTDGNAWYKKALGHGTSGWSPLYGGSPRVMTTYLTTLRGDTNKIFFTAPEDLCVEKVVFSSEVNVDADAVANWWGFNIKNYSSLATHTTFGGEMCATDVLVQEPWSNYVHKEIIPDQNRFMRAGTVLELLIDETGAPTGLDNLNFTVFYVPANSRTETITANVGTVSAVNGETTEAFLCRVPKNGRVDRIAVTSNVDAASAVGDYYDIQVTNLYDDGTGALELCSTDHNTFSDEDVYAYNCEANLINSPCSLVIDHNRFVMEGDILKIAFDATSTGVLVALTDCVVTVHLVLFDAEEVKAVQGTTCGNLGQITVPHLDYVRYILFTAPFDCRVRNIFLVSDTAKALSATDYVTANTYRFKKMPYDGTDPSPDLMNSVEVTTETAAAGAEAIDADVAWPTLAGGLSLADQNQNLYKGDVVKIEFSAFDTGGGVSELIGTNETMIVLEIEDWDPDEVGMSAHISG